MSNDAQPPRMLSAPLLLKKMTLRGLGPYLHGEELIIKPLTILCGGNGSGKSTWIETLLALRSTARKVEFPMTRLVYSKNIDRYGINQTLAKAGKRLLEAPAGDIKAKIANLVRPSDDDDYGPLGCIGLELDAMKTHMLRGCDLGEVDAATSEQYLLFRGLIPSGTKLKLRWAWSEVGDGFEQRIELRVNSEIICLRRSLDRHPHDKFFPLESKSENQGPIEPYLTLECTGAFLGVKPRDGNKPIELGYVEFLQPAKKPDTDEPPPLWRFVGAVQSLSLTHPEISEAVVEQACTSFLNLFRRLVQEALRGFFPIGSIRRILAKTTAASTPYEKRMDENNYPDFHHDDIEHTERGRRVAAAKVRPERRYVGRNGEHTQNLHAYWAYNLMRQPTAPLCGAIQNEFTENEFARFREYAHHPDYVPVTAADVFRALREEFQIHVLSVVGTELQDEWEREQNGPQRDCVAVKVFNTSLRSRNLFAPPNFRPDLTSDAQLEVRLMIGATQVEQDERFQLLRPDEIERVNRLLLETVFDKAADDDVKESENLPDYKSIPRNCWHRTGYLLETFVSHWMKWLTGAPIKYMKFDDEPLDELWTKRKDGIAEFVPNGGMVQRKRCWQKRGCKADQTDGRSPSRFGPSYDLAGTINLPTSGQEADWSMMSTGFHQLAPIVVQAGLLRQNEIMAVENPEAHLHPKLQIEVAKFLMHQANADKIMLIETHSDLIVRRIHRAIVQDKFAQGTFSEEMVGIHFTRLKEEKDEQGRKFQYAVCDKIEINDQGEIGNWPKGFLDDDIKESRRMFDAMYGTESEDDDDGQ